jgi:sterol desaturase/sphingolipid hydroxylase (fatty acid hydroxylase superfamily)
MDSDILVHEAALRLAFFGGVLVLMAGWELAAPRRRPVVPRMTRWVANLGLAVVDTILLRLAFPAALVGTAALASQAGWGLFNVVALPPGVAFVVSVLVLDLAVYGQHVVMHRVPLLWRLHRVHHTDVEFDTTSGVRFHPVEIALSMVYKMAVVLAIGAPAAAVLVFEVLLNAASLFNHGNVRLPASIDRVLRLAVVTPDMHRVHHSLYRDETDSNFGFSLTVWDRLFGTYRSQPRDGHVAMTIGLAEFRGERDRRLDRLLLQPLRRG